MFVVFISREEIIIKIKLQIILLFFYYFFIFYFP